jgi:hypothetical protein
LISASREERTPFDPAEVEAALLREEDEIDYRLGADWFERRGC